MEVVMNNIILLLLAFIAFNSIASEFTNHALSLHSTSLDIHQLASSEQNSFVTAELRNVADDLKNNSLRLGQVKLNAAYNDFKSQGYTIEDISSCQIKKTTQHGLLLESLTYSDITSILSDQKKYLDTYKETELFIKHWNQISDKAAALSRAHQCVKNYIDKNNTRLSLFSKVKAVLKLSGLVYKRLVVDDEMIFLWDEEILESLYGVKTFADLPLIKRKELGRVIQNSLNTIRPLIKGDESDLKVSKSFYKFLLMTNNCELGLGNHSNCVK